MHIDAKVSVKRRSLRKNVISLAQCIRKKIMLCSRVYSKSIFRILVAE